MKSVATIVRRFLPLALIAHRNVSRQKRRSITATVAVSFGVVAFVLAGGFIDWLIWGMAEFTIKAHLGHAQVMKPGFLDSGMAAPFDFIISDREKERKSVEALQDVVVVSSRLSLSGLISRGESTQSFVGDGVDPKAELALSSTMKILEGRNLSPGDTSAVILGEGLAASLGAKVGERVVLLANTKSGGVNAVEVVVQGIFSTVTKAYDDMGLRLPIQTAQRLLRVSGEHKWIVLLDDSKKTERFVRTLAPRLATMELQVVPWTELADFYNKTVSLFERQVAVMKLIVAAIIMLSISNSMMMAIMERTGEIGTAMALGQDKRDVLVQFLLEGFFLGLVGGLIGAFAGIGLAHTISYVGIPMPPPPGMAQGFTAEILVTPGLVTEALALACGTTILAAVYPAWKASQAVIVDALRHNR